jgi:hypothetical protein
MATDAELSGLPHIVISPSNNIAPVPPPPFVIDPALPPVPPPPEGFVPDDPTVPYSGQQHMGAYLNAQHPPPGFALDATPNPDDIEADEKGSPYRDAQAPRPPSGYVTDIGGALPESSVDFHKTLPGKIVDSVLAIPQRAFEASEERRAGGEYDPGPILDAAMLPMGTGAIAGVPVKGAEAILGAGPIRRTVVSAPPPTGYVLDGTAQALADDLQTMRQSSVADRAEVGNAIRALPPEAKTAAIGEKLYHAAEDPAEYAKLTPEEKAISDQHLDPLRQEQMDLALEAKKLGGDDLIDDPNYMHRIAKGHAPEYDNLAGSSNDPITGTKGLSRTTSALQERKFYAIESPQGVRKVITPNDNGITVWNNKVGTSVPTSAEIKPGEVVDLNGKPWKVVPARTREIEQHGLFAGPKPAEYHKNAFVNTADAIVRLREVVRNLKFVAEVKKSQWWLNHAVKDGGNVRPPKGWREPLIPQFKGWKVDPKITDVLDDFYKPGLFGNVPAAQVLREINQFATSSMFWNPIGHMQNVGVHWSAARGWDWIRPKVMRHFAADMTRAIKATVTQNHDYQRFLREGGGLVSGGVRNADFYGDLGRHMGMDIEKNWGRWKPLFNKLHIKRPYEAVAWWYDKMRNVLWQSSDMFMMHRYLELVRKGYSPTRAIKEAEKHIPNYRIPTEIMGSRLASMAAQEPALTVFMRYHYGMWKSFMHMATDLAKGSAAEKKEALGNVAALAFMGYVIYPVLDAIYQKVTGDPNAKMLRRGAMSVPHGAAEVTRDRQSFSQFLQSNITAAPATKEILQQFFGKDFFTGRELTDPAARAEHAAKALVSPYGTTTQMTGGGEDARSPARTALDTVVGGENTSEKTESGKQYGASLRDKAVARRRKSPSGPIESGANVVEKVLGLAPEAAFEKKPKKPKGEKKSHHNKEKGY